MTGKRGKGLPSLKTFYPWVRAGVLSLSFRKISWVGGWIAAHICTATQAVVTDYQHDGKPVRRICVLVAARGVWLVIMFPHQGNDSLEPPRRIYFHLSPVTLASCAEQTSTP